MPAEYGIPKTTTGLLPWSHVDGRLAAAKVYWIATSGPGGVPRVRPLDGLWLDGVLYVGGSPETRWARDIEDNQQVAVHLDDGQDVVILEGVAELLEHGVEPRRRGPPRGVVEREIPAIRHDPRELLRARPVRDPATCRVRLDGLPDRRHPLPVRLTAAASSPTVGGRSRPRREPRLHTERAVTAVTTSCGERYVRGMPGRRGLQRP